MRIRNPPPPLLVQSGLPRTAPASSPSSSESPPPLLAPAAPLTPGGLLPTNKAAKEVGSLATEAAMFVIIKDKVQLGALFGLRMSIIPSMHSNRVFTVPPSKKRTILNITLKLSG
jgi:hypothetical protein